MNRIIIFIDGSNFYHGFKQQIGNVSIDFEKFQSKLCSQIEHPKHLETRFYIAPLNQVEFPLEYSKQQRFFDYLRKIPNFNLVLGRLTKRRSKELICHVCGARVTLKTICPKCKTGIEARNVEKGVDVSLASDLIELAINDKYDIAILVSNDSDFVKAIEVAQGQNKKVYHAFFRHKTLYLEEKCFGSIILTKEFINDCLYKPSKKGGK